MTIGFDVEHAVHTHGAALRTLAEGILRDEQAADDAVSDALFDAVQRPPRHERSIKGWLASAVRHRALKWRRGEQRRLRREQAVARRDTSEDAAEVVAREEMLQRVVDAVRQLRQPYRNTIWQRYFDGCTAQAIAARERVPVATVKSRLQRGLSLLRADLGQHGSDWRAGLVVAFGLDTAPAAPGNWLLGGLTMNKGMKLAIAGIALVTVGGGIWALEDGAYASASPPEPNGR